MAPTTGTMSMAAAAMTGQDLSQLESRGGSLFAVGGIDSSGDWRKNGDGTYTAEANDSAATLSRDAGISINEADTLIQNQLGPNYLAENGQINSNVEVGDVVTVPMHQKVIASSREIIADALEGISTDMDAIHALQLENSELIEQNKSDLNKFSLQVEVGAFESHPLDPEVTGPISHITAAAVVGIKEMRRKRIIKLNHLKIDSFSKAIRKKVELINREKNIINNPQLVRKIRQ